VLRDGEVLAGADIVDQRLERARALSGWEGQDSALVLMGGRVVHTALARCPLDVAFLDADLVVLSTVRMGAWRVALPRRGCRNVLVVRAGALDRWGIRAGDEIQVREAR
jgi:hypothetical protein